jgi:hypothetical protein
VWQDIINHGSSKDSSVLAELNLTEEQQARHIAIIERNFGVKDDQELKDSLVNEFQLGIHYQNLAEKWGGETDLLGILEQIRATLPSNPSPSCHHFFGGDRKRKLDDEHPSSAESEEEQSCCSSVTPKISRG